MANVGMNGFELDDVTSLAREWVVSGSNYTMPATGRRTTTCLRYKPSSTTISRGLTADATYHIGFSFLYEGALSGDHIIGDVTDSLGNLHCRLNIASTGALYITAQPTGSTTPIWIGSSLLLPDTWYYLEWSTTCATSGSTAVYINGSATPDAAVYSGDTQNGSNTISVFLLGRSGAASGAPNIRVGDFYFNSGSGAIAKDNTRWGDTKVVGYLPNAAGSSNGLVSITTGTAASTNYQEVDDTTTDDDTTYVYGTAANDTYNFPALGFTPSVIQSVAVKITAKKTDAGSRTIAARCKSSATTSDATAEALGTSYTVFEFVFPQDPNTSASWDQTGYEAAEFGPKVA